MNKYFYSHIIEIDTLIIEIKKLDFPEPEKNNLVTLVDNTIYHKVIDVVLSELGEEDKQLFLKLLAQDQHKDIWDHLKDKVIDIEDKIKTAVNELIEDFRKDLEN